MDLKLDAMYSGFDLPRNIVKAFELFSSNLIELLTKTFEIFDWQVCKVNYWKKN